GVDSSSDDVKPAEIDSRLKVYLDEETPPSTDFQFGKQWVNLELIKLESRTQSRKETDQATIDDYAEQMSDGRWDWEREPLPILFFDETDYYPGDGHHRIPAAAQVREDIFAEIRPGTLRDAIFHSCQANRFHGLQRTRADKRNQVELLLKDPEWQTLSDRAIADHCGVSAPFVGNVRRELVESGTVNVFSERTDRKGRTIKTANIGTKGKGKDPKSNSSPDKPDISENLSTSVDQPVISENLVDEMSNTLQPPNSPPDKPDIHKTTQEDVDRNAKLQQESPIAPFEQKVIKQACDLYKPQSVVQFALEYATDDEKQELYDLLESTLKGD
ncbi:MAG: hypothetical protein LH702_05350, partial [Phormidesmis sp. CAN_BIN44]|nr:hypothetical protein [Phormidesmis sp. CAN_BIN44]